MSIDFSNESNKAKVGKEYLTIGSYPRTKKHEATIIYNEGIPFFDLKFIDNKFEVTDCILQVGATENTMLFLLSFNNLNAFVIFGIWRKDITTFEILENQNIKVPKFNQFKDSLPYAPIGGAIGYTIAGIRRQREEERRSFSIIGTKEVLGSIIKLKYIDDSENREKYILLSLPNEFINMTAPFFLKYWKNKIE
jgi:hypothetical protein